MSSNTLTRALLLLALAVVPASLTAQRVRPFVVTRPPVYCPPFPPPVGPVPLVETWCPITFRVCLPADAVLTIDGMKTTSTGECRTFETPLVNSCRCYSYTLTAVCGAQRVQWSVPLCAGDATPTFDMRPLFQHPAPCRRVPLDVTFVRDNKTATRKLSEWDFTAGTKRLGWMKTHARYVPDYEQLCKARADDERHAPEALVLRRTEHPAYLVGVETLIPISRIGRIDYSDDSKLIRVSQPGCRDAVGSTKFHLINKLELKGRVKKDSPLEVFRGGTAFDTANTNVVRQLKFAPPEHLEWPKHHPTFKVVCEDGKYVEAHPVSDLLPLYQLGTRDEQIDPFLYFADGLSIGADEIELFVRLRKQGAADRWELKTRDGKVRPDLELLEKIAREKTSHSLLGYVGRASDAYLFFPKDVVLRIECEAKK